jgi:low affinity Fe/Cu permease
MKNLRGYENRCLILKGVNNPVMFMGLPLRLSMYYLGAILVAAMLGMILGNVDSIPLTVKIAVPASVGLTTIFIIKNFYKKYGVYGYYLESKNLQMPKDIFANKSINQILKEKK